MHKGYHKPVLLNQVINYLVCRDYTNEKFIDCTVGQGGHAQKLLREISPNGRLLGIDMNAQAVDFTRELLIKEFKRERFKIVQGNFVNLDKIAKKNNFLNVDGILLDLGVSSYQLDKADIGISFKRHAPLDMRLGNLKKQTLTAYEIINNYDQTELVSIFKLFGQERFAKRIAQHICEIREKMEINDAIQLAEIIKQAIPKKYWPKKIHPATKVFQALRIAVNDELNNLRLGLRKALNILQKNGRLVVISFHSLEDKIVKEFFKINSKTCICPSEFPVCICEHRKSLNILTKKPILPSFQEIKINPRARSAKLRAAQKI